MKFLSAIQNYIDHNILLLDQAQSLTLDEQEQLSKIKHLNREKMQYFFSEEVCQMISEGVLTLKDCFLIFKTEEEKTTRYSLPADHNGSNNGPLIEYVYGEGIVKALLNRYMTLRQYMAMSINERKSMKFLFIYHEQDSVIMTRCPLAEGVITLTQYLNIPVNQRESMQVLFSSDGCQAVAAGVITLEKYLRIPFVERATLAYLFSANGLLAIAEGIITLEQYLEVPENDRPSISNLFSTNARQAVRMGVITITQFLTIQRDQRHMIQTLFSANGRQAILEKTITLEQYLRVDPFEHENLKDFLSEKGRKLTAKEVLTLDQYLKIPDVQRKNFIEKCAENYSVIQRNTQVFFQAFRQKHPLSKVKLFQSEILAWVGVKKDQGIYDYSKAREIAAKEFSILDCQQTFSTKRDINL